MWESVKHQQQTRKTKDWLKRKHFTQILKKFFNKKKLSDKRIAFIKKLVRENKFVTKSVLFFISFVSERSNFFVANKPKWFLESFSIALVTSHLLLWNCVVSVFEKLSSRFEFAAPAIFTFFARS